MSYFPLSGIGPIIINSGLVAIPSGSANQNGYISSVDWNTFNNKQTSGSYLVSGYSYGGGTNIYSGINGNSIGFFTLTGISGISVNYTNGLITISGLPQASSTANYIQSGLQSGYGVNIFQGIINNNLVFATITGNNSFSYSSGTIYINDIDPYIYTSGGIVSGIIYPYNSGMVNLGLPSNIFGNTYTNNVIMPSSTGAILMQFNPLPTGIVLGNMTIDQGYISIWGNTSGVVSADATIDLENRGATSSNYPELALARSRGAVPAVAPVQSGDSLGHHGWWASTDTSGTYSNPAYVHVVAMNTYNNTSGASRFEFWNTELGQLTPINKVQIGPAGTDFLGTTISPFGSVYANIHSGLSGTFNSLIVQGRVGQNLDLQNWKNYNGTTLAAINNNGIHYSTSGTFSQAYIQANATAQTTGISNYTVASGTYTAGLNSSDFTITTLPHKITYNGPYSINVEVNAQITCTTTGTNQNARLEIMKNGTATAPYIEQMLSSASTNYNMSNVLYTNCPSGTYFQIGVANTTSASQIIVVDGNLTINKLL